MNVYQIHEKQLSKNLIEFYNKFKISLHLILEIDKIFDQIMLLFA